MKNTLLILLILFSATAHAGCGQHWTRSNMVMELTDATIGYIDYRQTRKFLTMPGYYETNPLLGKYPSRARLRNSLAGRIFGHAAISYCLKPKGRRLWQALSSMLAFAIIARNHQMGIKLDF